jgi:hypothetical protein
MEVIPKGLQSRGNILFQLFSEVAEVPKSFLLGGGLQNLIQHLACLVAVPRGRPARGVAPEVYTEEFLGTAPLSDQAREGPLQSLLQPANESALGLPGLPMGHPGPENFPLPVLAHADR